MSKPTEYSVQELENYAADKTTDPPIRRTGILVRDSNGDYYTLKGNSDGSLALPGLDLPQYDYISAAYPQTDTEVYTYKTGGSGGTTVGTVTVVYTDANKTAISSVTKS